MIKPSRLVPFGGFRTPAVLVKKLFKAGELENSPVVVRLPDPAAAARPAGTESIFVPDGLGGKMEARKPRT